MKIKNLLSFILLLALVLPQAASAITLNLNYPNVPLVGDLNDAGTQGLDNFIRYIYMFIVWISGLAAFVMIVWNGFLWLTSAGNPGQIRQATDGLKNAALGLLVVLSSFIILQTISSQFIIGTLPTI